MIDRELYEAEELDIYVETHLASLAAELQPDLPLLAASLGIALQFTILTASF